MAKLFSLKIVTPDGVFFDGKVSSIVAPGGGGRLGVLANHAPLMTTLVSGPLTFTREDSVKQICQIHSGFMEVLNNDVTICTDAAQAELAAKEPI